MNRRRERCKNGTRRNKTTGECECVLNNTCAICLERIITGNVKTTCKHSFHKECLIGWCKRQVPSTDGPNCPLCRNNIDHTYKKIMPFNSKEVFRYTNICGLDEDGIKHNSKQIDKIIHNPKFDINVKNYYGQTLLDELCSYTFISGIHFKDFIEYLIQKPTIVIDNHTIAGLIGNKNDVILTLFIKHNKIPHYLKKLVDV